MIKILAGMIVVGFGVFLMGLAAVIFMRPLLARRFLGTFASSARAHYSEQGLRLAAGAGLVMFAPWMGFTNLFKILGWLMVITAVGLLLVPWRWHHRYGKWAIPLAIRHMKLLALGASVLGALILYGAWRAVLW